jgi:phosphoadenosine phosphosulfate reductase
VAFLLSDNPDDVAQLAEKLERQSLTDVLKWTWERFGAKAAVGTSFQGAGLVIMHHAAQAGLNFPVFTLDTGLLFPETLKLKTELEAFLGITIESLHPERTVEQQGEDEGPELWNRAPDVCCYLRKVVPLQNKLASLDVWITGVRRNQAETREQTGIIELYQFDPLQELYIYKLNPVAAWSREQVWDYIKQHGIPYNSLHDRGFRSIGCIPCTRPTGEGENERAGRWTGFDKTECGIHTFLGKAVTK